MPRVQGLRNFRQAGMKGCIEKMNVPFLARMPARGRAHSCTYVCVSASGRVCPCAREVELLRMTRKTNLKSSEVGTEVSEKAFTLSSVGVIASNCNEENPSSKSKLKNSD